MHLFAQEHGLPLEIRFGRPTLSACFAARIIGGRALPPFPQSSRDCSSDWKSLPAQRIINMAAKAREPDDPAIVTLIGTRSSESTARKIKTAARKETAHEIWYSVTGEARLSPILDWDTDDVWTYLGECAAGDHLSYSDFQATMEFYADAGASSCVIVAEMKSAGNNKACGAGAGAAPL
jgi:DNA sulfur modification protein DndC